MKVHGALWLLVKFKGESVDGLVYMYRPPNPKLVGADIIAWRVANVLFGLSVCGLEIRFLLMVTFTHWKGLD